MKQLHEEVCTREWLPYHRPGVIAHAGVGGSRARSSKGNGWSPHAHLVEAILKDMAPTDRQPEATVPPVVIPRGVNACSEVGALVVELYEAGNLEQRLQGALQQAGILPQQSVQQAAMLLSKPAGMGAVREDQDRQHR